ncbi:MAG UNVERIFIED_CONTAM: proteasome ATPase, partial [Thermobifida fusca]
MADVADRDDERHAERDRDELVAQVSYLEKELSVLRRKLADSPRHVRLLEDRLQEAQTALAAANAKNERLGA